jgi:CHAT domain-containing protein
MIRSYITIFSLLFFLSSEIHFIPARAQEKLDSARIAAEREFAEAEELHKQNTAESLNRAIEKYSQSLASWRAAGDRYGEAKTLYKIGNVCRSLSNNQKALEYYKQALPIWKDLDKKIEEADTLNQISLSYGSLGELQIALDYLEQALPLQQTTGNKKGEAEILNSMGQIYSGLGKSEKSFEYFNRALLLWQAEGEKEGEIRALNNIANYYLYRKENLQKALDYYNKTFDYYRAAGNKYVQAVALNNIGIVYQLMEEKEQALDYFKRSLVLWRVTGNAIGQGAALYRIALVERSRGNLEEALINVEGALDTVEALRSRIGVQQLRASYFSTIQLYYDFSIDLLMELNKKHPKEGFDSRALSISERTRARSLLEILYEARVNIRQSVDPDLLERERSLRKQFSDKLDQQLRLLNSKHTQQQAEAIDKERRDLLIGLQEIESQIRRKSPRYAAVTQSQPLSAKEIQEQLLDPDTMLLEFVLGEKLSYMWAVTENSIESLELPKRKDIEAAVMHVRSLVTSRACSYQHETDKEVNERIRQADADLSVKARELSNMLLGPVAAKLGKKRLIIVADGALHLLPFGMLPIPEIGGLSTPLLKRHEIVNLPSASSLSVLRHDSTAQPLERKTIAVLADPVYDANDNRIMRGKEQIAKSSELDKEIAAARLARDSVRGMSCLNSQQFERLPGTRTEALGILSLVPKKNRLGALDFDATISMATDPQLAQYRIIHFGTHSFVPEEKPELAGIVLSLIDREGRQQNGYLSLSTIYNLNLPSELVTLSACETGVGKQVKGEGSISLIRGFMYAGARRVVASSWKVDDEATAELMKHFYRLMLVDKLSPAAALRKAQLSMFRSGRFQSPYFWAAFQLNGEWR